jgi:glycosyltransferase involved in cell wall biosynthesis
MQPALTVNLMTAALAPGDAIGNYVLSLRRLLIGFGCRVNLYADWISPEYPAPAYPSKFYVPTGEGLLWYHYSIGADNLRCVTESSDYRLMDFHGVSPAGLFAGYDPYMERICRGGEELLPKLHDEFELCIVHSEYSRQILKDAGYNRIEKLPLIVDTDRYDDHEDTDLSDALRGLEYLLFVGRVVPQKDILSLLRIFKELLKTQPQAVLIIVGSRDLAPHYQQEIDRLVNKEYLVRRVLFLGHIKDSRILTSLYRRARFTIVVSEWESFCVPIVESMHFGTPVIGHTVPPVPEIMGQGGIQIDKHDPESAAERLSSIWNDAVEYEQLKSAAKLRAQDFTSAVLRAKLLGLFQRAFV